MQLRCAIIDDDPVFTDIIEYYCLRSRSIELTGIFHDASAAESLIDFTEIDFLILDIEMPGVNGIEFLQSLPFAPPVILVSRKKEYGADAFDHNCIDYLVKPISALRFKKAMEKVQDFFAKERYPQGKDQECLFVRQDRMWVKIPTNEILYIKADNNDVIIKTMEKTYKTHSKLKEINDQLPSGQFLQIHRSYIVQLGKIDKVDGEVIEINNRTFPVSKTYLKEMYKRLNIHSRSNGIS